MACTGLMGTVLGVSAMAHLGTASDGPGAACHAVRVAPAGGTLALQGMHPRDNTRESRWRGTPGARVTPHGWRTAACIP